MGLLKEMFLPEATPVSQANRELGQATSVFGRGDRRQVGHTPSTGKAQSDIDSARSVRDEDVTLEVPDEDMPGLQKVVSKAVKSGELSRMPRWGKVGGKKAAAAKGKEEPQAKVSKGKGKAKAEPEPEEPEDKGPKAPEEWDPDAPSHLPMPEPATFAAGNPDEDEYQSPIAHLFNKDNEPTDMPHAGGGSMPIPKGDRPKVGAGGPSPVGHAWRKQDLHRLGSKSGLSGGAWARAMQADEPQQRQADEPDLNPQRFQFTDKPEKGPGMLGRLFGRKK